MTKRKYDWSGFVFAFFLVFVPCIFMPAVVIILSRSYHKPMLAAIMAIVLLTVSFTVLSALNDRIGKK